MKQLIINNLSVKHEETSILKGLSLQVAKGQTHAIMGPNGAGKSTLALVLAGHPAYEVVSGELKIISTPTTSTSISTPIPNPVLPFNSTSIPTSIPTPTVSSLNKENVDYRQDDQKLSPDNTEQNLLDLSVDERAMNGVFLAFQYPIEVPGLSVRSFLRHAHNARFANFPKKIIKRALDFKNHLEKLADELNFNKELLSRGLNEGFSGGEKKRLEILQMAVLEPDFAILDESDSGLDVDAIKKVASGIKKVQKKFNTGVVIITHYNRILKYIQPDFVHILSDGVIQKTAGFELATQIENEGYG